jgi:Fe2+ or Zn2+ uptake regulation protein
MTNDDVTRHPSWPSLICDKCGQVMKLEDLQQKALKHGLAYPSDRHRYYIHCCYDMTIEDNDLYQTLVSLLRQYYGV